MGKSNLSEIVQNSVTNSGIATVENILSKNVVPGEPNLGLGNVDYTKVTVYEFPSNATIIIDSTTDNVKIIEIHPPGSYTAKTNNGDVVTKAANNNLVFVKKDSIEIIEGKKQINAKEGIDFKTNNSTGTGLVSASKLVEYLRPILGNSGAPIFSDITASAISYEDITVNGGNGE